MFEGRRVIVVIPVLDEEGKIEYVIDRIPRDVVDDVLVVDDGSIDKSAEIAREHGATVIELERTLGVGAAIRRGFEFAAAEHYDVVVVLAGNNKDSPEEIRRLLGPICSDEADLVQGSRWLGVSPDLGDMPLYRRLATRLHPALFSWVTGTKLTDSTNGFRAVCTDLLEDPRLDLSDPWLDNYELEVYLLYKAADLGYRVKEVQVTKRYPPRSVGQTKMRPISGWWSILRPLALIGLRLKK